MAVIGVLPLTYYKLVHGIEETKALSNLFQEYSLPKNKHLAKSFINSFSEALSIREKLHICMRDCENIICKIKRQNTKSDKTYRDILFSGQVIYEPIKEHINIYCVTSFQEHNEEKGRVKKVCGPILQYWPFENDWVKLDSYCKNINMESSDLFKKQVKWSTSNCTFDHSSMKYLC